MSGAVKEAADLLEILPETEQNFALELIKRLVIGWDPDYTKLTPDEKKELDDAERDISMNGAISHEEINWD